MIGQSLLEGKTVQEINLHELACLLFTRRNQFFRVIWHSHQNERIAKNGHGAYFKNRDVRKLYVATVRNGFSYQKRVERLAASWEFDLDGWQAGERPWGHVIPGTPFVAHQNEYEDGLPRIYGHFLVPFIKGTKKKAYHHIPGVTGYYVDGVKANDKLLRSLEYLRKKPTTPLEKAKRASYPVNARLDDIIGLKIGGQWYRVLPPTTEAIIGTFWAACVHGQHVVEAAYEQYAAI